MRDPGVELVGGGTPGGPAASAKERRVIPYPAIEEHGLIGDRRTAALVASDGTLDWLCLPDFDGAVVFGALLDWFKGGHWRLGPVRRASGAQAYLGESMVLQTRWELPEGDVLLEDAMLWPATRRPPDQDGVRTLVRGLRCVRGTVRCEVDLRIAYNFKEGPPALGQYSSGFNLQLPELSLRCWTSHPARAQGGRLGLELELKEGEELWAVLELGAAGHGWSVESARQALTQTRRYWEDWLGGLSGVAPEEKAIRRTALVVHALTYAPEASIVAAPTMSVPERIGGSWNADYRLCWVRDASLAVGLLARLGYLHETEQYLQWLVQRLPLFGQPLQVLYDIRGGKRPSQKKLPEASGYRESLPVRRGNHAYKQHQLGSYGYLADCVWTWLRAGGKWREEYWKLLERLAAYTVKHWPEPDNGIWELSERQHYVSSKVLSWVMLERAIGIARQVKPSYDTGEWEATREAIHREVMEKGWSERLGAFRQRYEGENLDAATLLISVMGFLPGDHPRVLATIAQVAEHLTIDGFVYRFNPLHTPGLTAVPMGECEGAFFPCTFWLATAYANAGQPDRADELLRNAEAVGGALGLFSEAADPRNRTCLGNMPLLFSHVEYVRAKLELGRARARS